ncbi:hypothetical protein [Phyllobacterium calauticae]|jgi:hypothetical protein|uniref:hypothetical protein n=1 Tax=Phyllobacterium calauticae TaxID=2817027 RepID=UPI001CC0CCCC|nr:hypothetical protein [Phyllobacterium calauticae]MBZ3691937.1 hypothetical protein [Phyllobacterium calauticae]
MSLCKENKVLIFTFFGAPYLVRSSSPDLSEPSASNRDRKGLNNRAERSRPVAKTGTSATGLPVDRTRLKTRNGDPRPRFIGENAAGQRKRTIVREVALLNRTTRSVLLERT